MEIVAKKSLSKKAIEDYEIVKRAVAGDQNAYTLLMNRYQGSIYRLMYKMVNDQEDAHDLTIEAFGKAFIKLPSYVPNYAFSTWLFRIAINNGIDHVRRKKLRMLSIDEPVEPDSDHDYKISLRSSVMNPEEQVIRQQRQKLMRTVITQLNDKYRQMIQLRYFDELSYDEISSLLNIPLGTVKAQLFRAKEMLYELLQKPGASAYLDNTKRS
jgi:RNA polymerase sigma-70 factor (ECF subfamily)